MPGRVNITAYKGDDETYRFTIKKDSNGLPVDLSTGSNFAGSIRRSFDDQAEIGVFTYDSGNSDLINGLLVMKLAYTLTLILPQISYYDIQYENGAGDKKTLVYGELTTTREITR